MPPPSPPSPAAALLSPLELTVLALAQGDPLSSLQPRQSRFAWLFGRSYRAQPLADPTLEALRRYAVLQTHRRAPHEIEAQLLDLLTRGFSAAKIAEIDERLGLRAPIPAWRAVNDIALLPRTKEGACMQTTWLPRLLGIALLIPCGSWAETAAAQADPPIDAPVELPGDGGPPPGGPGNGDHFAVGIGGAYMPSYQGSDTYRFQPLPAFDIKWGRFFFNFQDGLGATLIDTDMVTIGGGVTMVDNYRTQDAPKGVGSVPFGVGARGFVKLRQAGFEFVLGGTQGVVGGTKGFVADASLSYPIMVSERLFLSPSIGTTWANRKHLNRYFGINARQSADSGLAQFRLGSGMVDAKAELAAQYRLTDRIGVGLLGGVTTLIGDAKNSPIVKRETRPYGIFFVSYSF